MDALGINIPNLVGHLFNFIILLVIFRALAYKPILRMLDERKQRIQEGLNAAENMRREAAESERQIQERLEQARQEGQALIVQAQQIANRIQDEARQQAQQQAEHLLARARSEIELERDAAIADLRREFADLAIVAAERVINQSLDRQAHRRLIDEVLAQSMLRDNGDRSG